ncbi:MAG: SusD/RagB family nutrient-binding outer membrane lipoprotein [Paludibacteraceae bacterium]
MKKIILFVSLAAFLTGCSLDVNTNPNYPSNVSSSLVLPAAQNAIATVVGDGMYNYAGFFAQYYDQMPESNQYNTISEYNFTEQSSLIDRSYRTLYAGALEDLDVVIKDANATAADRFAATVLRAFSFQLLVDNMDKTPYTEALQGSVNSMPKWDDGKSVYEGVLAEIDAAESNLGNSQLTCSDLLLNKDLAQWKGYANALRLRMYLRLHDAGTDESAKIKALVSAGNFFKGDVKFAAYSDESDKRNPWYSANKVNLNTTNHVASYPIVTYLLATSDPRIAYNFTKATKTGTYAGELPGSKVALSAKKNADYSWMNYYATKPVYFFTQSELQFLLAESYIRFYNDDTKAKAAYEAGIDADFAARNMSESPSDMYGAGGPVAWSVAADNTAKLNLIYMQKWVALCYMDHMESWSEIRRTDVPKLSSQSAEAIYANPTVYTPGELVSPMRNGLGAGTLVKRMYFPLVARQLNTNTPASVVATTPVWWDIK